ncbi:hypothetical protein H2248_004328 [Termitomyces sp. 'cryptogamus']|nr:hypothetical protein H2248_004328 [Termitomyces sp. 'cryptogamus']
MDNLATFEGPPLAGAMISFALWGITCSQTMYYFRVYPGDHRFLKALVAILFIMESVHLASVAQTVHVDFIVYKMPEKTFEALNITLGTGFFELITTIIVTAVQSFYAWRVYHLSNGHRWQKPLVTFILATSLVQLGTGLTVVAIEFMGPPVEFMRAVVPRISYSVESTMVITCDLTISISLVYFLNKMRTGFRTSENVINRLIIFSMSTGMLTGILAICQLVTYYTFPPTSELYGVFEIISGKVYVNSMLATYVNLVPHTLLTDFSSNNHMYGMQAELSYNSPKDV